MEKIILIGGAPVVGKTFLAKRLSEKFKLPWISTDTIRGMMQKIVKKTDYPALFYPSSAEAKKYLEEHSAQEIMDDQNRESAEVWKGVEALLKTDYSWQSFIVEGVAILPEFVHGIVIKGRKIIPVFLYEARRERMRDVIFNRGLWDAADKYSDDLKEKEIEWVVLFNGFIRKEAGKYGFALVEYKDDGSHFEEIKAICE
jgi:2-phosphoglycerate kinase